MKLQVDKESDALYFRLDEGFEYRISNIEQGMSNIEVKGRRQQVNPESVITLGTLVHFSSL
jgi:hypothetical protein